MALSLDSIHQPLNDFFLSRFNMAAASQVMFRFDKFGSILSDEDFIDPAHPELGYLPGLAREKFSDLVNRIPCEQQDGLNIVLSQNSIDEAYFFHLLSPSGPFIPESTDDQTRDTIVATFSTIKTQAMKIWDSITLESSLGLMLQYKPSLASPEDWYNKSRNELWSHQSFQINQPVAVPADSTPQFQLWKLRVNDAALQTLLPQSAPKPAEPLKADQHVFALKANPVASPMIINHAIAMETVQPVRPFLTAGADGKVGVAAALAITPPATAAPSVRAAFHQQYLTLNVSSRIALNQAIASAAPTQPVKTNMISICFDYCVVTIRRPWYFDAFINDQSWFVPGVDKGQLTVPDTLGANLPLMPVGLVAVKNLSIEADWTAADLTNSQSATAFGPFKVDAGIASNKLSHPGIQIIGWLLQKMPNLPPNSFLGKK